MSLPTTLIDLDAIEPPTSVESSQFKEDQLEKFARLLLKADDTVRPIVLSRINPISFRLLEGYFEYYAAIKAQELNPQFTAIQAYVVPANLEAAFLEQYQFLRSLSLPDSTEKDPSESIEQTTEPITEVSPQPQNLEQLEQAITNRLEQKLSTIVYGKIAEQITSNFEPINSSLESIFNQLKMIEKIITPPTPKDIINDLNTMDIANLELHLEKSGKANIKFARLIYEKRLEQPFQTIDDVWKNKKTKITNLGEKTMQKIIEKW